MTRERPSRRVHREIRAREVKLRKMLGQALKMQRKRLDKTQKDVIFAIGLTNPHFLSNIENGTTALPYSRVEAIAEQLKLDSDILAQALLAIYEPTVYKILFGNKTAETEIKRLMAHT